MICAAPDKGSYYRIGAGSENFNHFANSAAIAGYGTVS